MLVSGSIFFHPHDAISRSTAGKTPFRRCVFLAGSRNRMSCHFFCHLRRFESETLPFLITCKWFCGNPLNGKK